MSFTRSMSRATGKLHIEGNLNRMLSLVGYVEVNKSAMASECGASEIWGREWARFFM